MADTASPLTPEQLQELHVAKESASSFFGAAKVAAFNGWTIGFFAVVSILSGLLSPTGLVVGVGLAVVTRNEFVGGGRLRALDPSGLELLWRNQIGFMALIIVYCVWSMYSTHKILLTINLFDHDMSKLLTILRINYGELDIFVLMKLSQLISSRYGCCHWHFQITIE